MTADTPIDPHLIALDAQALHEGGWPAPNARLRQLAELSALLGVNLWIAQGARDEVRGAFERKIANSIADLKASVAAARQVGLDADGNAKGTHRLLSDWDAQSERASGELRAHIIPPTKRPTDEFFAMGVKRVPPFDEKGAGFRDAVIYLSVVDEMSRMGLSEAIFVTKDKDFRGAQSPVAGQRIRTLDLTAAVQNLEGVLQRKQAALFEELAALDAKRQGLAREAVLRDAPVIDGFVAENLEIGPRDIDGLEGWLKKPISFHLKDVETVSLSPALEDIPSGEVAEVSATLEIVGEFEVVPFAELSDRRLRVGEDMTSRMRREAMIEALAPEGGRTLIQSVTFPVSMDLRLRRTAEGYADVVPTRVTPLGPSMRGLIAAMKSHQKPSDG